MRMISDPVCAEVSSPHFPSSSWLWPYPSLSVSASRWCEPTQWFSIMPKSSVYFHLKLFQIINIAFRQIKHTQENLININCNLGKLKPKFLFCYNHDFDIFIARIVTEACSNGSVILFENLCQIHQRFESGFYIMANGIGRLCRSMRGQSSSG